jgi:hypothetical protein
LIYEKICSKCGQLKQISYFHSSGFNKEGIRQFKSRCKTCVREDKVKNWYKRIYFDTLRSKRKNLPFNISPEFILNLFKKQQGKCYWFGVDLIPSINQKDPQMPTLDRIDLEKGYTKGNVVLACFVANIGRNETSKDRFKQFADLLRI